MKHFKPLSPDPNINSNEDQGLAKIGHLNKLVDSVNALGALKQVYEIPLPEVVNVWNIYLDATSGILITPDYTIIGETDIEAIWTNKYFKTDTVVLLSLIEYGGGNKITITQLPIEVNNQALQFSIKGLDRKCQIHFHLVVD